MTEDNLCECGHKEERHIENLSPNSPHLGVCQIITCSCKKFKAKTSLDKKSKGCGKEFMWIDYLKDKRICGQIEDLKHSDHIILCPECKGTQNHTRQTKSATDEVRGISSAKSLGYKKQNKAAEKSLSET